MILSRLLTKQEALEEREKEIKSKIEEIKKIGMLLPSRSQKYYPDFAKQKRLVCFKPNGTVLKTS